MSKKNFPQYLEEDFKIREFLKKKLKEGWVENVEIERLLDKINIIINTARPGLVIGRGGTGAEELKKEIERKILNRKKEANFKQEIRIEIREIKNPWLSASLVAQWIAQQIEKRLPFRKTLKQALDKVTVHKEAKGARVEVAGRLDGRIIAATEWLQRGQLPRQTLRAEIDFAKAEAHCNYGTVGVKVWIYKGEKF